MDTVTLATGAATAGIAFVALFTVDGEPDWWPEFERRFADHAAAWRRGRRLS